MYRPKIDYFLLFIVLTLSSIGALMVFSASPTLGIKHGEPFYYIKREIFYLALGFMAMYYGFNLNLELLRKRAFWLLAGSVALLILVFIPGVGRRVLGASRWIDLGLLSFQPTELIKIAMIVFCARFLSDKKDKITQFMVGVLPPLLVLSIVGALVMMQPDLGSFIVVAVTTCSMLFFAGMDMRQISLLLFSGIGAVIAVSVTSPYRFKRIIAYLDPWKDPQGIGFQIIQSLLAVGSGGVLGLGLGASRQKFFYLPQQFTDFIFAILCEEMGLLGGAGVITLFALFTLRGFRIANECGDNFKKMLSFGITAWISLQATINILVVLGVVPTTGIPLPFISYGGTATIINLFAAGILLNVSKNKS